MQADRYIDARVAEGISASSAIDPEIHLFDICIVFTRRWRWIAAIALAAVALSIVYCFVAPTEYKSDVVILPVERNSSSSMMAQMGGLAPMIGAELGVGLKNPTDLYVAMLRTRTVEDAVISRFGLYGRYSSRSWAEARKKLDKHMKISVGAKDNLITISITDTDPRMAAALANGYVEEYQKYSSTLAITEAAQRRVFFEQQLMAAKEKLAQAEDSLKNAERATGVVQIDAQTRSLVEAAATLRAQIVAKEVQVHTMEGYATANNPDMVQANQELDALRDQRAKLDTSSGSTNFDMLVPEGRVPEVQIDYLRHVRDVKYYETISDLLAKQYEAAKLDEVQQAPAMQLIDTAVVPDGRSSPVPWILIPLGLIMGVFLGCALCVILALRDRWISDPIHHQRLQELKTSFRSLGNAGDAADH